MRITRIGLVAGLVALAACGGSITDPGTPTSKAKPRTPVLMEFQGDEVIPEVYTPYAEPDQYCNNAINNQQFVWSIRTQKLMWDDPAGRVDSTIISNTLRILFRGYIGTYGGERIECVRVEQAYMDRFLYNNVTNTAHPATEWNITMPRYQSCWGEYQCNNFPPRIWVEVYVRWNYTYFIDSYVNSGAIQLENGGVETLNTPTLWKVELFPSGYWTVWDYGGNGGEPYGYWQWGYTGEFIPGKYMFSTSPGFYSHREGYAHWELRG